MDERRQRLQWNVLVPALLLLVTLLPRMLPLGTLTNPDELGWLNRSVSFYDALSRSDWAGTLQAFHPGVVPMWGFGALMCARFGLSQLQAWLAVGALPMADLARAAMLFPVLLSGLTVLATYGLVRRLAGREIGLYAALLLAVEPYYMAFTHATHMDLIHASLMLVAALCWLNYLHRRRWLFLVGGGIVAGLALLTRSASIYLVPFCMLAAGGYFLADNLSRRGMHLHPEWGRWAGRTILAWFAWLGLAALTVFALWPALWADPAAVVARLGEGIFRSVEGAHPAPVFFLGEIIADDPGTLYYWLILLFRLRPLTLILVILNPLLLVLAWRRLPAQGRAAWMLGWGYVAFYFVQMSLATHKLERYLLPIVLALSVLAGLSLAVAARWLTRFLDWNQGRAQGKVLRVAALSTATVLLAIPWLRLAPFFGTYWNQLVGGSQQALKLFTLGSGAGVAEAAAYLNDKPEAQDLMVPSFYHYVFQYYFRGQTQRPNEDSWAGLPVAADYMVIIQSQVQRDIYPATLDYFLPRQPEHRIYINGVDYAWVYKVPRRDLAASPPIQQTIDANFEGRVRLLGYDVGRTEDELLLTLYWQPVVSNHRELRVRLRLEDDKQQVIAGQDDPPWSGDAVVLAWPGGRAVQDVHTIPLPSGLVEDDYHLLVSLSHRYEGGQDRLLPLVDGDATELLLDPIDLTLPRPSRPVAEGNLGNLVRLVGYDLAQPAEVEAGSMLPLTLTWECLGAFKTDYTAFVHLVGGGSQPLAQADGEPLDGTYPTSFWDTGEWLADPYTLAVPDDVPPGEYGLRAGMYLLATGERLPLLGEDGQVLGDSISLGRVRVTLP
jgi:4-amino-4-deoxy-L-arabinose transferase-like glycosyltransferase